MAQNEVEAKWCYECYHGQNADYVVLCDRHARVERLEQLEQMVRNELLDWRKWYGEEIFTEITVEETQAVHQVFPGMVDRISASSARHAVDELLERIRTALNNESEVSVK